MGSEIEKNYIENFSLVFELALPPLPTPLYDNIRGSPDILRNYFILSKILREISTLLPSVVIFFPASSLV